MYVAKKEKSLAARREELLVRSAIQREQFAVLVSGGWQPPALSMGRNLLQKMRGKPLLAIAISFVGIMLFRRRRMLSLMASVAFVLKNWAKLSPYLLPLLRSLKQFIQKKR